METNDFVLKEIISASEEQQVTLITSKDNQVVQIIQSRKKEKEIVSLYWEDALYLAHFILTHVYILDERNKTRKSIERARFKNKKIN